MRIRLSHLRKIIREELEQAKGLDPVGHEDEDINNDGKIDDTDDYLHNRRKKISASMHGAKKQSVSEVTRRRIALLREDASMVADIVLDYMMSNPSIDTSDLVDTVESGTTYSDAKAFLALPEREAMTLFAGVPDPKSAWLNAWKAAQAIVFSREG